MSKISTTLALIAGIAIGGASAWYVAKARYEEMLEEDVSSTKQAFHAKEKALAEEIANLKGQIALLQGESVDEPKEAGASPTVLASNKNQEKGDINAYAQQVQHINNYTQRTKAPMPKTPERDVEAPYVISPDEFGELDGYTLISLTYFDDGILSDEKGVIIEDPEEIVGDALEHFGEYEEDSVFVRSDPKRCDYEILRDLRSYAEFRTTLPPKI